jgi:aryl-alcohol dehydrogenase-like predicted oxidoreductase
MNETGTRRDEERQGDIYTDRWLSEGTYACMKAAYDCGVNFFDCAEAYAGGESEKVMGEAIKKFGWNRNDLVISTKVLRSPSTIAIRICCHGPEFR